MAVTRRLGGAALIVGALGALVATTLPGAGAGASTPVRAATSTACGGVAIPKVTGGTWVCTSDDEFSGTALDASMWAPLNTAVVGNHPGQECDTPTALSVTGGQLAITATRNTPALKCGRYKSKYSSGGITSKFAQTYGRFSMRAKFPAGKGFQPVFWMLPQNPNSSGSYSYGEIDVAEAYSYHPDIVNANVHYVKTPTSNSGGGKACSVPTATTDYHTYTLEWTPQTLTFIYDDTTCWVTTWAPIAKYAPRGSTAPTPFNQPYYLIINLAVGDYHTPRNQPDPRTRFPTVMSVDYIRVWS